MTEGGKLSSSEVCWRSGIAAMRERREFKGNERMDGQEMVTQMCGGC